MAEILGTVASGLAVAEVGLKVGGTVWKLKKLWQEIQGVPETIQDLMRQIELMDPILSDHETNLGIQSTALPKQLPNYNGAPAKQSIAYCREALNDLRRLVDDLDGAVESEKRSRRTVARMKVVLKKNTLKGFHDRLERAIRLLQWTQVNYLASNAAITGAMVTDVWTAVTDIQTQQQLILQQLGNSNHSSSIGRPPFPVVIQHVGTSRDHNLEERRGLQRQSTSFYLPWSRPSIFGAIVVRKSRADFDGEPTYAARVHLPKWLSQQVWDISINRVWSGWQWTISTWNIVPDNSPGMLFAKKDNLVGLIDLFHRGLASPRDCNARGRTIFHMACRRSSTRIVSHFINMNMEEPHISAIDPNTAIGIVANMPLDVVLPLVSRGCLDIFVNAAEDFNDEHRTKSLTFIYRSIHCIPPITRRHEVFKLYFRTCFPFWLDLSPRRKQEILMCDFPFYLVICLRRKRPVRRKRPIPMHYFHSRGWAANSLRLLISPDGPIRPIDAQAWIEDGASLLHVAFIYFLNFSFRDDAGDWITLLVEVIKATSDVHHKVESCWPVPLGRSYAGSALKEALDVTMRSIFTVGRKFQSEEPVVVYRGLEELTANVQSLMSVLDSCGHNLLEYGREEARIWTNESYFAPIKGDSLYLGISYGILHIRSIHYGAEPRDWYFELDFHYEDYVGAFWNLVESPHLFEMPGAWIDEEWDSG